MWGVEECGGFKVWGGASLVGRQCTQSRGGVDVEAKERGAHTDESNVVLHGSCSRLIGSVSEW
jgi:hypothetical protein